jgi:hypothetical protein
MINPEINLEDLQKWYESEEVTYASSTRERKSLTCTLKGNFIVRVAGSIVWQGVQPFSAVEAYNSVTKKFIQEKFTL